MVLCSEETMTLTCAAPMVIRVDRAVYGHYDNNVCPGLNAVTNCHLDGDYDIVDGMCSGLGSCDVVVGHATFQSDPCPNSHKYLDLDYTCVFRELLVCVYSFTCTRALVSL